MEDLNKNQIVLLTLLVSFVTSIATGIMTVSLLQQAPLEVTRTLNQIVQKTIETVVPGSAATTSPKEITTTVVVKEDDLIVSAVNKNIKSIVRIKEKDAASGTSSFYGIGLVVSKDGSITSDRKAVTVANTYTAVMSDGAELSLALTGIDKQTNFILFKANNLAATNTKAYTFVPVTFADGDPQLGQTLISVGGDTSNAVSVGRVVSLQMKDSGTSTTTSKTLSGIETDVATKDLVDGSPLLDLSGNVIGIKLDSDTTKNFSPIFLLEKELPTLTETPKTQ